MHSTQTADISHVLQAPRPMHVHCILTRTLTHTQTDCSAKFPSSPRAATVANARTVIHPMMLRPRAKLPVTMCLCLCVCAQASGLVSLSCVSMSNHCHLRVFSPTSVHAGCPGCSVSGVLRISAEMLPAVTTAGTKLEVLLLCAVSRSEAGTSERLVTQVALPLLVQGKRDACNVCGGDNTTCTGCDGISGSGMRYDMCGQCRRPGSGTWNACVGCDHVGYSGKVEDACGVCGGDNSSCVDCRGGSITRLRTEHTMSVAHCRDICAVVHVACLPLHVAECFAVCFVSVESWRRYTVDIKYKPQPLTPKPQP